MFVEEWRDIPGYEGLYQVSNLGRVKSLRKGKIMSLWKNNGGYYMIALKKNLQRKNFLVHRLVWEAFKGPIPTGMQVNHIDEDVTNCALYNLNLLSQKDNNNWGRHNERMAKTKGRWVIQLSMNNEILHFYHSSAQAERETGVWQSNIRNCCIGKVSTAGGFKWVYSD